MAAASIIASVITGGSNSHQTVSEELNAYATDFVTQGIVGAFTLNTGSGATGSFGVQADSSPDMGITILLGQAYVLGTPSGQGSQVIRCRMTSNYTAYTINANASGSTKYDWIYLQLSATNANNPSATADNVITLFTSRSSSNTSDNGSPPTYGLLLAVVTVANGASSITNANITDKRQQVTIGATTNANTTGWNILSYALTYASNAGNKEFTVTTPYDVTGILSAGMKLKVSRSATPPTQAMKFVKSSTQWANKTSPSGYTFTGVFTQEAWIKIANYPSGGAGTIIGRRSGSAGSNYLRIDTTGQLSLLYGDASGNFTQFQTYQAVPLNRWVHVAGVCTSVSGKTGIMYINGAVVPSTAVLSAATTLVQAGDLGVGGYTGGNETFDGQISEARVWSTNQTQANIQANMTISLVGTETNLVALYQGNGVFTDATSNANNLTAQNGAIATNADNPYNATEYAVITKVSYSNPTTTITLFTGTDNTIPNQTLNNPYFSSMRAPYGFQAGRDKWRADCLITISQTNTISVNGTWVATPLTFAEPTGEWILGYQGSLSGNTTGAASQRSEFWTLASSAPTNSVYSQPLTTRSYISSNTSTMIYSVNKYVTDNVASATTYTLYVTSDTVTATEQGLVRGDQGVLIISAECAYI